MWIVKLFHDLRSSLDFESLSVDAQPVLHLFNHSFEFIIGVSHSKLLVIHESSVMLNLRIKQLE